MEKETPVPFEIILFLFFDDAVDAPDLSTRIENIISGQRD